MKTQLNPLELLEKFLRNNTQEELEKRFAVYDSKSSEGPTVKQYFEEFNLDFITYHNETFDSDCDMSSFFHVETYRNQILNTTNLDSKDLITVKVSNPLESSYLTGGESNYALAA